MNRTNASTTRLPDRLLTPDLLLREPDDEVNFEAADRLDEERVIVVRSSGKVAGRIGLREGASWLELAPEHRGRGRGSEAIAAWLTGLHECRLSVRLPRTESGAALALYRDFGLKPADDGWHVTPRTSERLHDLALAQRRRYVQRVHMGLLEFGVPGDYGLGFGLPMFAEAPFLRGIGPDVFERPQFLAPAAAEALERLVAAAARDEITLQIVSGFRGFDDQVRIVQRKRRAGQSVSEITAVSALPGYSEHHTGGAVDLATPGSSVLEEEFATTDAYRWLVEHAASHGFRQSFPRGNPHGIAFEPWHWCHAETADSAIAMVGLS